ncbi:MAG: UDP-glucose/GDP-mannose dehydrogenase family protein [Proteobacteria bacterium]|nr:UDP-glucose/GDP-mannose dehydrogenase family protein [Pseudomonadota bacterium]
MTVRIAIIGTGYVGLVSGACFAELGHDVVCVDKVASKIDMLNSGGIPIYEPGLEEIVRRNSAAGRLRFTTSVTEAVQRCDAVFIAVGTPTKSDSDHADLSYVYAAAEEIAKSITGFTVVVSKSTVPVGTNRRVLEICRANIGENAQVAVASNPEFLREGAAINDFMCPDRIVVGADDQRAQEVMERIYSPLTISRNVPLISTSTETAELTKYAANAFLAAKISFINEMADLCEAVGANINDVSLGIGLDSRIGRRFLNTGPGWGGSCFPKDTRALLATAEQNNVNCKIVQAALEANEDRKRLMIEKVIHACGGAVNGKRIAVFGLTFKGQTDDMRESTSLVLLPALAQLGAQICAFDPSDPHEASELIGNINTCKTPEQAAEGADLLVILTDWMIFKTYDLKQLAAQMRRAHMLDLRNMYSSTEALAAGFTNYTGLGMPPTKRPALLAVAE